jgi:hypothetical protein
MQAVFPMVPLAKRQALCVGIMSYDGQVNFGLIGDYDAMDELEAFAADLQAALDDLFQAAGGRAGFLRRLVPSPDREAAGARVNGSGDEHAGETPDEPGSTSG